MSRKIVAVLAGLLMAGAWSLPSARAAGLAADSLVSGTVEFDGRTLRLTHGLAWWNAEQNELRLALFDHAPPAAMLADLRSGAWGEGGPGMTLRLRFERGLPPTRANITYCYLDASFETSGPIGTNTDAAGCGLSELGGALKAGGGVAARLEGDAPGPRDRLLHWDVRFSLPIAK